MLDKPPFSTRGRWKLEWNSSVENDEDVEESVTTYHSAEEEEKTSLLLAGGVTSSESDYPFALDTREGFGTGKCDMVEPSKHAGTEAESIKQKVASEEELNTAK
jgi:hypothetical protein